MSKPGQVPGRFITFEGIDGSGKSTQARLLADHLREAGHEVVLTREPGGSPGAEDIRALVLEGSKDRWTPETELLLFTAARRDHLERVIDPALARGAIVICDRYVDSTRMYQGLGRADLRETVDALHRLMINRDPDLTVLIDMDPDQGLTRALARGEGEERFESFGAEMQARIRQGFLDLAKEFADRFVVINGNRGIDDIAGDIRTHVTQTLA